MKGGWRLHALLAGLALLQLGVWFARHRSSAEWTQVWETGSGAQRLRAAHVLLNRGPRAGECLGADLGVRLLAEERDPRVRSLAFASDVCKLASPRAQLLAVLDGLERGEPAALVNFVLQCRKVGGEAVGASSAMHRVELDWYTRAHALETWSAEQREEIRVHLEPWVQSIRDYLQEGPR